MTATDRQEAKRLAGPSFTNLNAEQTAEIMKRLLD